MTPKKLVKRSREWLDENTQSFFGKLVMTAITAALVGGGTGGVSGVLSGGDTDLVERVAKLEARVTTLEESKSALWRELSAMRRELR